MYLSPSASRSELLRLLSLFLLLSPVHVLFSVFRVARHLFSGTAA